MSGTIHEKSRNVLKDLKLPSPLRLEEAHKEAVIDLSSNTNPYGGTWAQYSDLSHEEIKTLYLKNVFHLNKIIDPALGECYLKNENLMFTVGSIEGIDLVQRAFAEPYDTICVPHPSFEAFQYWGHINSLRVVHVPLFGEQFEEIDIDLIRKCNPKILFLCNPNNPTGTLLKKGIIRDICTSISGFVVVDEAYIELAESPSNIQYLKEFKNLIVLRTLSKAWGMAGLRCGVVLSGDPTVINSLRYIQIPYGLSSPSQIYLAQRLKNLDNLLDSRNKIIKIREKFKNKVLQLPNVKKVFNSSTNFLCVVLNDLDKTLNNFQKEKILIQDCSFLVPNAVRISISKPAFLEQALSLI